MIRRAASIVATAGTPRRRAAEVEATPRRRRGVVALLASVLAVTAWVPGPVRVAASGSPDFSVTLSPGPTLNPGTSGTFTASVTPLNGETSDVTVTAAAGYGLNLVNSGAVTASPPTAVLSAPTYGSATFTLSSNDNTTPPGAYNEYIVASDTNGNVHTYNLAFAVTASYADFTLSPSSTTITVAQGTSGSMTVALSPQNGFNADVDLTVNPYSVGLSPVPPYGLWANGTPVAGTAVSVVSSPYPTQVLSVTVPSKTAPGSYTLMVSAESLNAHTADRLVYLTVVVVANGSIPSYTLALSSCPTYNPGTSTTFTATITPLGGESVPITLTPTQGEMQVSPPTAAVVGPPYAPQTFTVSQSAKLGATAQTVYVEGVDANGITYLAGTSCSSTSTPADFSLSAAQTSLTIPQGGSATDAIAIPTVNGMNSDVQMSAVPTTVPSTTGAEPLGTWSSSGEPVTDVAKPYPTQQLTVAVSQEVAVGTYAVRVDAVSYNAASTEQTVTLTVNVVPGTGDFTLRVSSGPTFNPGTSATFTATVTPLGAENVPITLVPVQSAGQITPPVVVLQPPFNGPITQTFIIAANAHVPAQQYPIEVAAMDGHGFSDVESSTYTLTSAAADFSLAASPSSISVPQTHSGSLGIAIHSYNGMHDDVQLSVARGTDNTTPSAPTPAWSNGAPVTDVASSSGWYPAQSLSFGTLSATPLGTYHYVVTATSTNSASVSHATDVYVTVTSGALDFGVSFSRGPTFNPGTTATITATVSGLNGDSEPVTLVPDQGAVTVSPATATLVPGQSVTFQLSANASVSPCACMFTLTAVGQQTAQAHRPSTAYTLTSNPAGYSLSASPISVTVPLGGLGSTTLTIAPRNGMTADVDLAVTPAPGTAGSGPMPVPTWRQSGDPVEAVAAPYAGQVLTFTDVPADRGGTYHYVVAAISGNAGPATQSLDLYVTVPWPSFTLWATPCSAINPGTSQSFTVDVSPVNGDTSPVTLVPQQGVATATPAQSSLPSASGSVQLSLAVGPNTPAGSYTELVTGVDRMGNAVQIQVPYTVTSTPASFSLSASPGTTHPGAPVTVPVVIWPHNGYTSDVVLAVTPAADAAKLPGPVPTWSNGAPVIDVPASSTQALTFTVPSATLPGVYHYYVVGTSPSASPATYAIDEYLTVNLPATNGFTMSASAGPTLNPGTPGTVTVSFSPGPQESSPISLVPGQGPAVASPQQVVVQPPYAPVTFQVATSAQEPAGAYTLAFVATDRNGTVQTATTVYTLTSSPTAFTVGVSPSTIAVQVAHSSSTSVAVTPQNGLGGSVTLVVAPDAATTSGVVPLVTWSNGGSGTTSVSSPYPAQTLNVAVGAGVPSGSYQYTIVGASQNAMPPVATATLIVVVPAPGGSPVAPAVTSVSPSSGPPAGGTTVTITGSNFIPAETGVTFGTVPASNVIVSTPTQLTATSPIECSGTYDVSVSTPLGTSAQTPSDLFTVTASPPTITSVSPSTGTSAATTIVTVSGTNLVCPGAATINSLSAALLNDPLHPNTPTQLQVAIPPQPYGTSGDLVIHTPAGASATVPADLFHWQALPPQLTGISPASGPSQGGEAVVLSGAAMSFATAVRFGGAPASNFTVNSDTQVTAIAPPGCGSVPVTVTTAAGISLSATFTYVAGTPSVTGLSPAAGPVAGGNRVVVTGSDLLCATDVSYGGQSVSFHPDSDSQITTTAPPGAPGFMDVVVSNAVGSSSTTQADEYTYDDVPVVAAVSPDAGATGGGTQITITGQSFAAGATVTVGGNAATSVNVVFPTTIQAVTPPGSSGPVDVIVTDPGGSSARSTAARFFYGVPTPSSVSPSAGPSGGGGDVRISGSDFAPDTTVSFGGQQVAATVLSPTLIDVPLAPCGTPGTTVAVTLSDPAGTGSSSSVLYTFAYRPTVTAISPTSGGASGGTQVTISGTDLTPNPAVFFGSVAATAVTVNANGSLTATTPPGTAGSQVDVTVQTVGGRSTLDPPYDTFTYELPPSGTGIIPVAGPAGTVTHVKIYGSNFFAPASVTFGGVAASHVTVDSQTEVEADSPGITSPGSVSVVVTTGSGSTTVGTFSYDPVPTAATLDVNAGPAMGDPGATPTVTITGTGFLHDVTVSFGSVTVTPTSVNQAGTSLSVVPPPEARSVVQVVVNTDGGTTASSSPTHVGCGVTSTSNAMQYAYGAPGVSAPAEARFALSPPGGPLNTATQVTICGSNFVPGAAVTVGGVSATQVQVVNTATITAYVPAWSTSGRQDVLVSTGQNLVSTPSSADQYLYGPPVLSSIAPTAGPAAGGQTVTVAVSNFVDDGVQVTVNGTSVSLTGYNAVAQDQATFTIVTPSNTTTTSQRVPIAVSTDGGLSGSQQYTYWAPPTVTGVSLSAGPSSGYRTVTVTGSNFVDGNIAVSFGGAAGTGIHVLSRNSLTVTTPQHAPGTVDVQVSFTQFGGTSSVNGSDNYQFMGQGYDIVESNGAVHTMNAPDYGSPFPSQHPISGMAFTPDGRGYWIVAQDGGVFTFGDAGFYGSMAGVKLNAPVNGIVATPDGHGYWLVAGDGGIFTFGDAPYYGGEAGVGLNRPISGMAATPNGGGYWLLGQDGGIFTFGNAGWHGGDCCQTSITAVGIAGTSDGQGYWIAYDDGIVSTHAATPYGQMYPQALSAPLFGIAVTPTGNGYWLFGRDGAVYSFGDASFQGRPSVPNTATAAAALFAA